jgi:soluble lytic murein transglycosylase-like protein
MFRTTALGTGIGRASDRKERPADAARQRGALLTLRILLPTLILLVGLYASVEEVHSEQESIPDLITKYAALYGANPDQLLRVTACESGLNPLATGLRGERGVLQVERFTWQELAPQIGVSANFDEAYSAPSNVAVAAYSWALGETWRWRGCW